ncbi:MAG: B12-binding domain-containing radical SAM protein [Desulfuromonadaceae bacterium]|nr:B12-binding domain-containing radical SAM protein [Desulfuromonadaceae bacterium]
MKISIITPKNNYPSPEVDVSLIPQGVAYLSSVLAEAGHQVVVFNPSYIRFEQPYLLFWAQSLTGFVRHHQPELILLSGLTGNYRFVSDTMRILRMCCAEIPIVLGGGIVTYDREYVFNDLTPDYALVGDAEESVVALAAAIENKTALEQIDNLSYWVDGTAVFNPVNYSNASLDLFPYPDYDALEIEKYYELLEQSDFPANLFSFSTPRPIPISTGRSCPFKCTFCCHTGGQKYRQRSIASVIDEIRFLYEKYRFNILFIYDELFSVRAERIFHFCDELEGLFAEGMSFEWTCALRLDDVDGALLSRLKETNCAYVGLGFESGSNAVLKSMRKGITREKIEAVSALCRKNKIGLQANFIFGDRAETEQTFQESLHCFERFCKDSSVSIGYIIPFPGAELFAAELGDEEKRTYYSGYYASEQFYLPFYNLTQMDNLTYLSLLLKSLPLASPEFPEVELPLNVVKEIVVREGGSACREGQVVEFCVVCPYCGETYRYCHRCVEQKVNHFAYCRHCHRRAITDADVSLKEPPSRQHVTPAVPVQLYKNYFLVHDGAVGKAVVATFAPALESAPTGLSEGVLGGAEGDDLLLQQGFMFLGPSVESLTKQIDESGIAPQFMTVRHSALVPYTLESYLNFTILEFGLVYFAVCKKLSNFNLRASIVSGIDSLINEHKVFVANSKTTLLSDIDAYYSGRFGREKFIALKQGQDGNIERTLYFFNLLDRLEKLQCREIGLYGAGGHTKELIAFLSAHARLTILFIVESEPSRTEVFGCPVCSPEQAVHRNCDALVLSSDVYEREMWHRMKQVGNCSYPVLPIYEV